MKKRASRSSRVSKSSGRSVGQLGMWDGRQHLRPSTPPTINTVSIITTPTTLSSSTLSIGTAASQQCRSSSSSTTGTSHTSTSNLSSGTGAHAQRPPMPITAAAAHHRRYPSPITATDPFSSFGTPSTGTAVHQHHHPSSTGTAVHHPSSTGTAVHHPSSTGTAVHHPSSTGTAVHHPSSTVHQHRSPTAHTSTHQHRHPSPTAHTSTHQHRHPSPTAHTSTHQHRHRTSTPSTGTATHQRQPPPSIPSTSTGETAFQQCNDLILLQNSLLQNSIKHRKEVMNQSVFEREAYEDIHRSLENEKVEHAATKCLLSAEQEKTQLALTEIQVLTKQLDREKATFEKAFGLLRSQALSDTTKAESLVAKCSALESLVGGKDEDIARLKGQVHELMERIKDMRQSHKMELQEAHVRMEQEKYLAQHFGENSNNRGRGRTKPRGQR